MGHPLIINLVLLSLSFNLLRTPMHWRDLFTAYAKNLWHVLLFYRPNNKIFQRVNVMAIRVCCTRIHAIISPHMAWPLPTQRKNHRRLECACVMVSFSEKNSFEIHFIRRNSLTTPKFTYYAEAWKLAREWPPDTSNFCLLLVIKRS